MLSEQTKKEFLSDLARNTGVTAVYFHKDKLWIENEREVTLVHNFLNESDWGPFVWYEVVNDYETY